MELCLFAYSKLDYTNAETTTTSDGEGKGGGEKGETRNHWSSLPCKEQMLIGLEV